jgi:hypothetical protein
VVFKTSVLVTPNQEISVFPLMAFVFVILTAATSTSIYIWRSRRLAGGLGAAKVSGNASVLVRVAFIVTLVLIAATLAGVALLLLGT